MVIRGRRSKNKMTKRQTMIYEILHRKLKIDLHGAHKKPGRTPKKVNSSCLTSDTRRVTVNDTNFRW